MSRLTNGIDIGGVAIQPYASPIQTNVLPAPGQQLGGNTLQQIAESLAVFNSGLVQFSQAMVNRDNRMEAERGAAIDFESVFARGDQLNKNFRQIVQEMNLPDSANPYFMVAAERNFGASAAMKVRNSVISRMPELSNPQLDSASQAALLRQIVDEETQRWGGQRIQGNFYAGNSFNETVSSFMPEVERQANEAFLKNKETQALTDLEDAMASIFQIGKQGVGEVDERFMEEVATKVVELQKYTTDPEKVTSAMFRAAVTSFQSAQSVEEIEAIEATALSLPFGQGKTVADSMSRRAQLAAARERAEEDLDRRGYEATRRFARELASAERTLSESGFASKMIDAIKSGRDPIEAQTEFFSQWKEQNPNVPRGVVDELERKSISLMRELVGGIDAGRDSREIVNGIISGKYPDLATAVSVANAQGRDIREVVSFWDSWHSGAERVQGQIPQQSIALAQSIVEVARERGVPRDGFRLQQAIAEEVTQRVGDFVGGKEVLDGRSYQQVLQEGGKKAAESAVVAFSKNVLGEIKQREEEKINNDSVSQSQRNAGADARDAVDGLTPGTPQQTAESVRVLLDSTVSKFGPIYQAFTVNPTRGYTKKFSNPSAVADRLVMLLEQDGAFEIGFRIEPTMPGTPSGAGRMVQSDGDLFTVLPSAAQTMGLPPQPIAAFTRAQLLEAAVQLRMSPLAGLSVADVVADRTGVPGVSLSEFKRQNGRFPWDKVPVFASREEYMDFVRAAEEGGFSDEQKKFLRTVLNDDLSESTVAAFRTAQRTLIEIREAYMTGAR